MEEYERLLLKKEQELEDMRLELKDQEENLEYLRKNNFINLGKRKWKTLAIKMRIAIPALFITGGVVAGFHHYGCGYPFIRDNLSSYRRFTIESNYDGEVTEIEDVNYLSSEIKPKLVVYSPYKKSDKGYTRQTISYYLENVNKEELYAAIKDKDYNYFVNNLGKVSQKEETTFYLPEDNSKRMVAVFSYLSDEYVCELPETFEVNMLLTSCEVFVIAVLNLLVSSKYILNYSKKKEEINEEFPVESEEGLIKYMSDIKSSINDLEEEIERVR